MAWETSGEPWDVEGSRAPVTPRAGSGLAAGRSGRVAGGWCERFVMSRAVDVQARDVAGGMGSELWVALSSWAMEERAMVGSGEQR